MIGPIWPAFRLSLFVAATATVLVAVFGTALGLLLAKGRFRGKEVIDALITLPMLLPPTVTGYYLIYLLGRRGLLGGPLYALTGWSFSFTVAGAVAAATIIALPIMVKSARAAIESINPEYEIVSYTLGKGRWKTLFKVTLPLAQQGLLAGLILSFTRALGEFGATLMLAGNIAGRTQTMPLAIYEAVVAGDDALAWALVLLLTGVSLVVVFLTNLLARKRPWRPFYT